MAKMSKLVCLVGANGSGKTTLAKLLGAQPGFAAHLEQHAERPYQDLFTQDTRQYALPNQLDYLLRRAEQELDIRQGDVIGVQDGGLDQDYHLYTHLFHQKGFLDQAAFDLCARTYHLLRQTTPPPDYYIWLSAPTAVLQDRIALRNREVDQYLVTPADVPALQDSLAVWLATIDPAKLIKLDVGDETLDFVDLVPDLVARLTKS